MVAALLALALLARQAARAYGLPFSLGRSSQIAACAALLCELALARRALDSWQATTTLACAAVCAASDWENGHVFDLVLLGSAALLLVPVHDLDALREALLGAAAAAGLMLLPYAASRGRGLGLGDVKLACVLGLGLTAGGAVRAVWFACVCGGAVASVLLLARRVRAGDALPFAPFLAFGSGLALLWPA